ncbi:terpene synthase family protein [Actinospica robiniae]|uniref:Metal-binding protein, terpene synthase family n=1 Tax=Actinospica robiniae DSM 44927 TaxID=479430 RepID=W9DW94_9ACTN|nr:terpene synthase family protein [Actinospica robiniae]ETA71089.1 metal-binding protein, terpene synthase family [Actinospica robiniae DSM 44927]
MSATEITHLFDLPELQLIPGERAAPWGPQLDASLIAFVRATGLLTTETALDYYTTQHFGTMCAYVVPGAVTQARREIYGKLMAWFFIYDDWAEQLGRHLLPEDVAGMVDDIQTWFADDEDDVRRFDLPAARSMRTIWAQIREDTSPQWRDRLREELGMYLRTAVEEARLVRSGRVNPLGAASELRPLASAARPVYTMAEYAYGIELTPETVRHPLLRKADSVGTAAIAYANDIIGLKADLLRGIRDNLVLSLQHEHGGTLQANVERAAAKFHQKAAEFLDVQEQFRSGSGLCDATIAGRADVATYLQILEDWLFEGVKWQLRETDRYDTTVRLTDRENPNQLLLLSGAAA